MQEKQIESELKPSSLFLKYLSKTKDQEAYEIERIPKSANLSIRVVGIAQSKASWNLLFSQNPEKVLFNLFLVIRILRRLYSQKIYLHPLKLEQFVQSEIQGTILLSPKCESQLMEAQIPFSKYLRLSAKQLIIEAALKVETSNYQEILHLKPQELIEKIKPTIPDNSHCLDIIKSLLSGKKLHKTKHFSQNLNKAIEFSKYFELVAQSEAEVAQNQEKEEDKESQQQIKQKQNGQENKSEYKEQPNSKQEQYIGRYDYSTNTRKGLGVFFPSNSELKCATGIWSYDRLSGPSIFEFNSKNIDFFMGESQNNEPVKGFMQMKNGARYYGSFKNGLPDGQGLYQSADNKNNFCGYFEKGSFKGVGEFLDKDKQISIKAVWDGEQVKRIIDEEAQERNKERERIMQMEGRLQVPSDSNDRFESEILQEKIKKLMKKGKNSQSREMIKLFEQKKRLEEEAMFRSQKIPKKRRDLLN